ncbi:MAG: hypothetical protein CMN55_08365 [Sneathiella sp.]|jgi:hypothetical protein|nr:hypothetical protein [Sneathiella sp.]
MWFLNYIVILPTVTLVAVMESPSYTLMYLLTLWTVLGLSYVILRPIYDFIVDEIRLFMEY